MVIVLSRNIVEDMLKILKCSTGQVTKVPLCENILDQSSAVLSIEKSAIGFGAVSTYEAENFRYAGPWRYTITAFREIYRCPTYAMPVFKFKQLEKSHWPTEYLEYRKTSGSEQAILDKSDISDDEVTMREHFSNAIVHNNPAFYETLDPDGVRFVSIRQPYFALSCILPMSRVQQLAYFKKVLHGNIEFVHSPLNSIFLTDKLSMKFACEHKVTIDGEAYTCKDWEVSTSGPEFKLIM